MSATGTGGCGPGPGPASGTGSGASNPRKFSEKIALHTQRQAEETAAFQEVMMDITSTRVSRRRRQEEESRGGIEASRRLADSHAQLRLTARGSVPAVWEPVKLKSSAGSASAVSQLERRRSARSRNSSLPISASRVSRYASSACLL